MSQYQRKVIKVTAIKWTGDNIAEVREIYPGISEGYMRDKGCLPGDYVVVPNPSRVYFMSKEGFEALYEAVVAPPPQYDDCIAELKRHLASDLGFGIMAVRPEVFRRVLEYHEALVARLDGVK